MRLMKLTSRKVVSRVPKLLSLSYEAQVKKTLFGDRLGFPGGKLPQNIGPRILSPSLFSFADRQKPTKDILSPALLGFRSNPKAIIKLKKASIVEILQVVQQFNSVVLDEIKKSQRQSISGKLNHTI